MTDHAKCRVCGSIGVGLGPRVVWIQCKGFGCGVQGPLRDTEEEAWAAWDELMRPAIPEPLRELVRAVRRLKLACGYVGSMGKRSRVVARSECIHALEALPPDLLSACLKETAK